MYLYQAYYYKVDKKRINEFGQVAEPEDEVVGDEKKELDQPAEQQKIEAGSEATGAKVEGAGNATKRR